MEFPSPSAFQTTVATLHVYSTEYELEMPDPGENPGVNQEWPEGLGK